MAAMLGLAVPAPRAGPFGMGAAQSTPASTRSVGSSYYLSEPARSPLAPSLGLGTVRQGRGPSRPGGLADHSRPWTWHVACRWRLAAHNRSIARVMRGKSVGIDVKTP